jgi:hypothetical protein
MNKNIRRSIVIAAGVTGAWALGSTVASADELPASTLSVPDTTTDATDATDANVTADGTDATGLLGVVTDTVDGVVSGVTGTVSGVTDGATGTVTAQGGAFGLLRIGEQLYLKADAAFWNHADGDKDASAAGKLDGKYVKVPQGDPSYKQLSGFTDKDVLLGSLLGLHGKLTTGDRGDVDGVRTIRLSAAAGSGGTLDVSLEGRPYPLRLQRAGGAGVVRLDDWGKPVDLKAPAKDQVVDYGTKIP